MTIWQADFYRRPLRDEAGESLWELLLCHPETSWTWSALCPQVQATGSWVAEQLQQAANSTPDGLPQQIQFFRPQSESAIAAAGKILNIQVQPQRHLAALKQQLQARAQQYSTLPGYTGEPYQPLALDRPPPVPLPEALWGDRWRFAALPAGQLKTAFAQRPIPILEMPKTHLPVKLGLASNLPVPGVVIDGGRSAMRLARWLQEHQPAFLTYIPGQPDGLILEAGLVDRWVLTTFEDTEVAAAGKVYEQRKQQSRGLHFLLVQPDDAGVTYSGFWLLKAE